MNTAEQRRNDESVRMKNRIKKAALTLFLRDGIDAVTMRKIAGKIKYSPGTIYNYFADKNEIFLALRQDGFALFRSYQERSRGHKIARKRILAHGRAYLEFALENPRLYELMFIVKAPMDKVAGDIEKSKSIQSFQYLKDDITSCMREGLIKKVNADIAALSFWSFGHGLASLLIRQRLTMFEETDREQLVAKAADYLYSCVFSSPSVNR